MNTHRLHGVTVLAILLAPILTLAQTPAVAVTVNGQPIPEKALQRALQRVPPAKQAEAKASLLEFLIENALVDQYLTQLKVGVEKADVDKRIAQLREEIVKGGQTVDKVLAELLLTEAELQAQVESDLRWERFVTQQGTEAELRKFYDGSRETFDGTQVRARHILLTPAGGDAKAVEAARAQLETFRKQVEAAAAKVPAGADPLAKEKARVEALEQTFASLAKEHSVCPTKTRGGDVDWFPRTNGMVEPFARAAFGLKPFQLSEIVQTQFGLHLILVTDRRAGKEVKFEEVKAEVKEVYGDRLREAVVAYMRARAKVEK